MTTVQTAVAPKLATGAKAKRRDYDGDYQRRTHFADSWRTFDQAHDRHLLAFFEHPRARSLVYFREAIELHLQELGLTAS